MPLEAALFEAVVPVFRRIATASRQLRALGMSFEAIARQLGVSEKTLRVGEDFVNDVSKSLKPNRVAVVAEVDEAWTIPVDTRMEALGGTVFRRALWAVQEQVRREEIAAMKSDLAQFKSEVSKAHADRKAKLQKKIDQLEARIEAQQKKAIERREAFEERQKAKKAILKKNAAAAGHALKSFAQTQV